MELTTQCPQCGEIFEVSLEQLQLRKGYVRCIACACIFDGYEAVVPALAGNEPAAAKSGAQVAHELRNALIKQHGAKDDAVRHVRLDPQTLEVPDVVRRREPHRIDPDAMADSGAAASPMRQDPVLTATGEAAAADSHHGIYIEPRAPYGSTRATDMPAFLNESPRRFSGWARAFWLVSSLLGLVLLGLQAVYIYRMQLADSAPALRPLLERLCVPLECTVDYPRDLAQISVLSSSLRVRAAADTAQEQGSALMLDMTLRNAAARPQQWPDVTLDLTDFSGAVVVRKVLRPSDYLPLDKRQQPFAARSELAVQLPLNVQGSKVNGYQLSVFFP